MSMYLHTPALEVGSWWRVDTASGSDTATTVYAHDGTDAIPTALGTSGSTVRNTRADGTALFWSSAATLYCKELTYQGAPNGTVVTSAGATPTTPSGSPGGPQVGGPNTWTGTQDFTGATVTGVIATGAAAGGDLSGTLPSPTVAKVNGVTVTGTPSTGYVPTATGSTTATWQAAAAVTTYASGLELTVGRLVVHQGITYRVTTSHTTGPLPDLTKLVAFNAELSIFYPESYGAIGDGTAHPLSGVYGTLAAAQAVYPFATALTDTLDQCGIQAAINAAVAAGPGVVQLADKTYVVNGSFRTTDHAYALLYIPYLDPAGSQFANIEIRGVSSGTGLGSPTGDAAGGPNATIIKTTLTGVAVNVGRVPCVIGGPTFETTAPFTAVDLTIRNLMVQCPTNPTVAGIDLAKVLRAYLDGVNVNTVNAAATQPTALHAFGVRMPDVSNYGLCRVGSLGVFGFYAAVVANTEHFNADDLTLKYNYGGLCLTGRNGWHGTSIRKYQAEWQCYHLGSWTTGGIQQLPSPYPAIVNIDLFDIEDAPSGWYQTVYHVIDDNNLLRGRINYLRSLAAGSAGLTTSGLLLRGATKAAFVDLFMPVSNYGGSLLAVTQYNVPSAVTTTSATFADVDATNLKVTFTAPSSGDVVVALEAMAYSASGTTYAWNLRDSNGDIANTKRDVHFGSNNPLRIRSSIYVTGLTPGTSYTWKWGHGLTFGSGSSALNGNGATSHAFMTVTAAA